MITLFTSLFSSPNTSYYSYGRSAYDSVANSVEWKKAPQNICHAALRVLGWTTYAVANKDKVVTAGFNKAGEKVSQAASMVANSVDWKKLPENTVEGVVNLGAGACKVGANLKPHPGMRMAPNGIMEPYTYHSIETDQAKIKRIEKAIDEEKSTTFGKWYFGIIGLGVVTIAGLYLFELGKGIIKSNKVK